MLRGLGLAVSRLLFPRRCPACGRRLEGDVATFCAACEATLPGPRGTEAEFSRRGRAGSGIALYAAPFWYEDGVRTALTRFKFRGRSSYAPAFARCMAESWRRAVNSRAGGEAFRADVVTWIPVSARRRRQRGYDQAELLARSLGDFLGVPAVALLEKTEDNAPQSSLDAAGRSANVTGVYAVRRAAPDVAGKTVLLVDDILTTGATASEAAFTLSALRPARSCAVFAAKTRRRSG